jgi:DNA-binding transcriptional regulator LsrR (DeoR family)
VDPPCERRIDSTRSTVQQACKNVQQRFFLSASSCKVEDVIRQNGPMAHSSVHRKWTDANRAAERGGRQGGRYPDSLKHAAATLYYVEEQSQAAIAAQLGVSVATVSRLLSEARQDGMVRIQIVMPSSPEDDEELATALASALAIDGVRLATLSGARTIGEELAPALSEVLRAAELGPGDALLVSSGRTVYEAAQAALPSLPGIAVAPMVGGQDEPEVWYATNEITRQVAATVGGTPVFLYAPAMPGPELYDTIIRDPSTRRVLELWDSARCAVMGIGAPPLTRSSLPAFVVRDDALSRSAVGDICSRFYDRDGREVRFTGYERLVATSFESLRRIPTRIGVAAGVVKVPSLLAAARALLFTELVTDRETARALLESLRTPAR